MDEEREECERRWWFMSYHGVPDGGSPLPCLPSAPGAVPDRARLRHFREHGKDEHHDPARAMAPYALILQMMIEDLGSSDLRSARVSFGDALVAACSRLNIDHVALPKDIQGVLLRSAFTMITSGGIPGAPEAG
jgi:hypothetical protein